MKILVTGGAGFIGSNVVDAFVDAGHEVVIVDNLSSGNRANVNPAARLYEVDIRSDDVLRIMEQERPEIVDHHAAHIDVRHSVADPLYDASINISGSLNLLEACRKTGVRKVIYISTGGAEYGEPDYLPCDENHPIRPLSPYGASKHTVEHYLFMYGANFGLEYTILRYPNIYGPRQDPYGEAGVIAIWTEKMLKGEDTVINGTGKQERDFLYVGDCVSANLLALEGGNGREYNLGWGVGVTINDIWTRLGKATGYQKEAVYAPAKTGETFKIYLDTTRVKNELGWTPKVPLDEGLTRTVEFFTRRDANPQG